MFLNPWPLAEFRFTTSKARVKSPGEALIRIGIEWPRFGSGKRSRVPFFPRLKQFARHLPTSFIGRGALVQAQFYTVFQTTGTPGPIPPQKKTGVAWSPYEDWQWHNILTRGSIDSHD